MDSSKITPHPVLYETRHVPNGIKLQITSINLKQNKSIGSPYSKEQFNKLLKS